MILISLIVMTFSCVFLFSLYMEAQKTIKYTDKHKNAIDNCLDKPYLRKLWN